MNAQQWEQSAQQSERYAMGQAPDDRWYWLCAAVSEWHQAALHASGRERARLLAAQLRVLRETGVALDRFAESIRADIERYTLPAHEPLFPRAQAPRLPGEAQP